MRALDLFCGAGGASMGLSLAGFDVTGIDIKPQPRYPFRFIQADALYPPIRLEEFDLIWASPPCQAYSEATPLQHRPNSPALIEDTRRVLEMSGKPFVIENVENARRHLHNPVMLCGTMFQLPLWRHRYFECQPELFALLPPCNHQRYPITVHSGSNTRKTFAPVLCTGGGDGQRSNRKTHRPRESVMVIRWAMGIPWMLQKELTEAIPPAYAEFIGREARRHLEANTHGGCYD